MESMKRYKDGMPEYEPPRFKVFNMLLGKSRGKLLVAPVRMKQVGRMMLSCGFI